MENRNIVNLNIVAYPEEIDLLKFGTLEKRNKINTLIVKEGTTVVAAIVTSEDRKHVQDIICLNDYNGELKIHLNWFIDTMNNKVVEYPKEQFNLFETTYDYQPNEKLEAQGLKLTLAYTADEKAQVVEMSKRLGDEVMATLEEIWTGRDYWNQHPVTIIKQGNKVVAYHCLAINSEKYPGKSKDYYSMVEPEFRGKGLSKAFIGNAFRMCNDSGYTKYVTSCYSTGDGKMMFDALGIEPIATKENPFGGFDYLYEIDMSGIKGYRDLKVRYAKS